MDNYRPTYDGRKEIMSEQNAGAAPVTETSQTVTEDTGLETAGGEGMESVAENAEAVIADPTATKAEKVAAKKMLKNLTIKVDGKEYNEDLPFEIEDDPKIVEWMQRNLQLSKVSQKRMQEKSEIENEVRQFLQNLQDDPESVLSDPRINVDLKKFAVKIMEQEIENEKKSPSELKAEKLEKELKALKAAREEEEETRKTQTAEKEQAEAYERYNREMESAFSKNPDVPKTPATIERISQYIVLGLKNGLDPSPEDVIHIVREELDAEFKHRLSGVSDEMLETMIGKDKLSSLQKKKVAAAKAAQAAKVAPSKIADTGNKGSKTDEKKEVKTIRGWLGV